MLRRNLLKYVGLALPAALFAVAGWTTSTVAQDKKADPKGAATAGKDIVDTAMASADHKTLVTLVKAAGLVETLKEAGPYTLFGPTDAAFKKLDAKTLADLQLPENKAKLANILKYHVVKGKALAADVKKAKTHKTVQGQDINVAEKDGKVMINDATVTKADIDCSNGVIHVIDGVLMPKEKN